MNDVSGWTRFKHRMWNQKGLTMIFRLWTMRHQQTTWKNPNKTKLRFPYWNRFDEHLFVIGKIPALRKWPWGNAKFWVIFFYLKTSQKASNMLMQHSSTTQTKPKLIKSDIFFSAIFWDKLRGHFRILKSQNISHALCAHFSWLRTARWDEKSGWWRCPKLDAKTLPNSQQPKRKNTQNVSKKQTVSIANFSC